MNKHTLRRALELVDPNIIHRDHWFKSLSFVPYRVISRPYSFIFHDHQFILKNIDDFSQDKKFDGKYRIIHTKEHNF